MSVTVTMDSLDNILRRRGLETRGKVQQYVDSEVLRRSSPYLPFDTGMLEKSGINSTVVGSGEVVWKTPYARRLYYGDGMNFQKKRPLSGSKWFERMRTAHKRQILDGAAKVAGGMSG